MNPSSKLSAILIAAIATFWSIHTAHAQYAVEVVSYDPGATPQLEFGTNLPFDLASSALGEPTRFTGQPPFEGVVSVFNPPFQRSELVSIGKGGHLVLRLSNFVLPQVDGPEIGVFTHAGLIDTDYPNGRTGAPLSATEGTFGVDRAIVDVSADGTSWVSLGEVTFDMPTNGYSDLTSAASSVPGLVASDFQQPLVATLDDFSDLPYFDANEPDILDLLAGGAGGTWLDISATGLAQVGYVRFSVEDDLDPNLVVSFELDGVSIAHEAMGAATVPEPASTMLCALAAMSLWMYRARRFSRAS